jgi:hypothetical protein
MVAEYWRRRRRCRRSGQIATRNVRPNRIRRAAKLRRDRLLHAIELTSNAGTLLAQSLARESRE